MKSLLEHAFKAGRISANTNFEEWHNTFVPELKAESDGWIEYFRHVTPTYPKEYGQYEVFRKGCNKQHYETWNTAGWAYNNNDITHYRKIISPLSSKKKIPLEDITDEDALYIGKIAGISSAEHGKRIIHNLFIQSDYEYIEQMIYPQDIIHIYQYLQLRNYQLPTFLSN